MNESDKKIIMNVSINKPYSESCDQNRDVILSVIQTLLEDSVNLFEIGSGTGQHAVYFADRMPKLTWYTSDCEAYLPGIRMWIKEAGLENTRLPVELDVSHSKWPTKTFDAVFTANSVHIMNQVNVEALFDGVGELLNSNGFFIVYGPFNYNNEYTSASNESFDGWLKSRDPKSGIKNFEDVCDLAIKSNLVLESDIEMPANNRILVWTKKD